MNVGSPYFFAHGFNPYGFPYGVTGEEPEQPVVVTGGAPKRKKTHVLELPDGTLVEVSGIGEARRILAAYNEVNAPQAKAQIKARTIKLKPTANIPVAQDVVHYTPKSAPKSAIRMMTPSVIPKLVPAIQVVAALAEEKQNRENAAILLMLL